MFSIGNFISPSFSARSTAFAEMDRLPNRSRRYANSMGKTTETALAELFTDKPRLPRLIRQENTDSGITLQLELQADLVVFDGHFPGLPILPGVAQLEWAVHFGHTLLGTPNEFQRMDAIKFQKIMQPGEQIELTLNRLLKTPEHSMPMR